MGTIPYTHWAYFPDEDSANSCARELQEFVTRVDKPLRERDPEWAAWCEKKGYPRERCEWLLRAARDVETGGLPKRHEDVEEVVTRHGGEYDGGDSGWISGASGPQAMPDPAMDNPTDPRAGES